MSFRHVIRGYWVVNQSTGNPVAPPSAGAVVLSVYWQYILDQGPALLKDLCLYDMASGITRGDDPSMMNDTILSKKIGNF